MKMEKVIYWDLVDAIDHWLCSVVTGIYILITANGFLYHGLLSGLIRLTVSGLIVVLIYRKVKPFGFNLPKRLFVLLGALILVAGITMTIMPEAGFLPANIQNIIKPMMPGNTLLPFGNILITLGLIFALISATFWSEIIKYPPKDNN